MKPTKLKIISFDVHIEWVDGNLASENNFKGQWSSDFLVIRISNKLKGWILADTFIHEVLHAINYALGQDDSSGEEDFVRSLSPGLIAFKRDNPHAWEWWDSLGYEEPLIDPPIQTC